MSKVRIFSLAKELGMANKDLIAMAADAGIEVKSSALASVSEAEADTLRGLASKGGGGAATATAVEEPTPVAAPRRETPAEREIRDLRTKPVAGHRSRQALRVEEEAREDEGEAAEATEESAGIVESVTEAAAEVVESVAERASDAVDAAKATAASAVEAVAETVEAVTGASDEATETVDESAAEVSDTAAPKADEVEAAVAEATDEPAAEVAEVATAEDSATETTTEERVEQTAEETVEETVEHAAAEEPVEAKPAEKPVAAEAASAAEAEPAADATAAPDAVKKTDYVNPAGEKPATDEGQKKKKRRGLLGIRNMQAVGTIRKPRKKKGDDDEKKGGDKPAVPGINVVRPNFTGPKPEEKKSELPAQKPDLSLKPDFTSSAPLRNRMENQKDRPAGAKPGIGSRRRPGGPTSMDQIRQQRQKNRSAQTKPGFVYRDEQIRRHRRSKKRVDPASLKNEATIESPVDVRDLSEAIGRPANNIIGYFMKQGVMKTINAPLTDDEALEVSLELGVELHFKDRQDLEDELLDRLEMMPEDVELAERPPIVTILGHVDHGKTTLVDALRSSNVTGGEAGGITQHIAAYQVEKDGRRLTFVDTPGHAAFGAMRARGADLTDIVVLVVAADDGVMPQTIESISHAKEAGVPIVVAMNKMDLPDANEQKVFTDLAQHGLQPQEWGGETEVVRVSALKGEGIDDLIETLLLTAEIEELQGTADIPAHGVCLEGFRDEGRGPMAWAIVQQGELRVGDNVVCGGTFGRVRAIYDENDNELQVAGPSTPVRFTGLDEVPMAGVHFFEMDEIDAARELAERRNDSGLKERLLKRGTAAKSLEDILSGSGPKELPLIIKADTPGSVEAIRTELEKFEHDEVGIRIVHDGIGGVNESDVYLASTSGASVIAFQVIPEDAAASLADREEVEIRRYSIIYELLDDIRAALEGLLEPERREVPTGRAIVLATFSISKVGTVAGCRVLTGTIGRNDRVHVIRDQTVVGTYAIGSLRREKDDAKEVREGMECGIRLDRFNDVKEGDLLEGFRIEEIARTLEA